MKILGILFLSLIEIAFYQTQAFCQTQYFSNTIDLSGNWAIGTSVIANDTAYHIIGPTGPGPKIGIVEVGLTGNVNWIKTFGKPGESWYPGNQGAISITPLGGYILGGSASTADSIYGTCLRLDEIFDTVYMKKYSSHLNYGLILTCAKPTYDYGFIFTGDIYVGDYNTDVILLKADSLGNELWRTTKSIAGADRGWSIIQTPDSGYVVGGYTYIPGQESSGDPFVVKFDENGNYSWKKIFGGEFKDDKAMLCLNDDSTFTVLTNYTDSMYTPEVGYSRINLIKIHQTGNIVWNRKYGVPLLRFYITNIKKTQNEGFICSGTRKIQDTAYDAGWLFRFTPDGDSLWFRYYMYYTQYPGNKNQLWDVDLAPDGGFIATGQAMAYPPNDLQKIWVLKVDSIGCDTAGCDPTVGIEEEEETWGPGEEGRLVIWPNPASEGLSVKCLGLSSGNNSSSSVLHPSLVIYDILGRTATAPTPALPQPGEGEWRVDISTLPPGIYLIVVKDDRSVLGTGKFVVSH